MRKSILNLLLIFAVASCSQIEEKISQTVTETKEKVQQQAETTLQNTVSESLNSLANAEDVELTDVFSTNGFPKISKVKGKKILLPTGSTIFVFKYNGNIQEVLPYLEAQESTNEKQSDQEAKRVSGESFINKLLIVRKFIPENTIDTSFLDDIKNDPAVEYYQLRRYPNKSTVIYQPKSQQIFHLVEISK